MSNIYINVVERWIRWLNFPVDHQKLWRSTEAFSVQGRSTGLRQLHARKQKISDWDRRWRHRIRLILWRRRVVGKFDTQKLILKRRTSPQNKKGALKQHCSFLPTFHSHNDIDRPVQLWLNVSEIFEQDKLCESPRILERGGVVVVL